MEESVAVYISLLNTGLLYIIDLDLMRTNNSIYCLKKNTKNIVTVFLLGFMFLKQSYFQIIFSAVKEVEELSYVL